jgi:hypothetical protein
MQPWPEGGYMLTSQHAAQRRTELIVIFPLTRCQKCAPTNARKDAPMKRLTWRYKKWLMHRQRYVSRRRRAAARLSHAPSTHRIVQLYTTVQKLAQQLAYRESFYVIWAYSQYLQIQGFHIPDDIEVAAQFLSARPPQALLSEWTLEQITREVIQSAHETSQGGRSLRQWAALAQIANALRDLEGEIYARLVGGKKIHLELMRISHRQFIWQQQSLNWRWIIRYYKLFNTPPIDALSQKATGLTIDHIYLIGMSYLGMFLRNPFAMQQIKVEIPGRGCEGSHGKGGLTHRLVGGNALFDHVS